jgi:hypothetical protein
MVVGAVAGSFGRRIAHYAVAGTAGSVIVKGASSLAPRVAPVARRAMVRTLAAGIVAGRKVGEVSEEARLKAGDLLAEARVVLGETASTPARPAATASHDHDH